MDTSVKLTNSYAFVPGARVIEIPEPHWTGTVLALMERGDTIALVQWDKFGDKEWVRVSNLAPSDPRELK